MSKPDPSDPSYYDFDAPPHCAPFVFRDGYLMSMAEHLRGLFNERGMAATTNDLGQVAWIMEEAAREIRRLQLKSGELIDAEASRLASLPFTNSLQTHSPHSPPNETNPDSGGTA